MGFIKKLFSGSDISSFSKKIQGFANTPVNDIMSKNVMTVTPDETLVNAANIMIGYHYSCLIVVDPKDLAKPVGIITERDFLRRAHTEFDRLKDSTVKKIMARELITAQPNLSIMDASDIMNKHFFRKLIVTHNDKLIGILTQTDLVRKIDSFYQSFRFKTSDILYAKEIKKGIKFVKIHDSIEKVHKFMNDNKTSSVFIVNEGEMVGTFTEYDFLSQIALQPESFARQSIETVMSSPVIAIDAEAELFEANHLMIEKNFRRLPVLQDNKLIGKLSQTVIRQHGFEILNRTLQRAKDHGLEKVNFERVVNPKYLVRAVSGRTHYYTHAKVN